MCNLIRLACGLFPIVFHATGWYGQRDIHKTLYEFCFCGSSQNRLNKSTRGWFWLCLSYTHRTRSVPFSLCCTEILTELSIKRSSFQAVTVLASCQRTLSSLCHFIWFVCFVSTSCIFFCSLYNILIFAQKYTLYDEKNLTSLYFSVYTCTHIHIQENDLLLFESSRRAQTIKQNQTEPMVLKEKLIHITQLYKANYVSLRLSHSLSLSTTHFNQFTLRLSCTHRLRLSLCVSACLSAYFDMLLLLRQARDTSTGLYLPLTNAFSHKI